MSSPDPGSANTCVGTCLCDPLGEALALFRCLLTTCPYTPQFIPPTDLHQHTYVSIHLSTPFPSHHSIQSSIHPFIQPHTHQPSRPSTHKSLCLFIEPANQQAAASSHPSTHALLCRSTHSLIYRTPPFHRPFIRKSIPNPETHQGAHH